MPSSRSRGYSVLGLYWIQPQDCPRSFCLTTASLGTQCSCLSNGYPTLTSTASWAGSAWRVGLGIGSWRVCISPPGLEALKSGLGAEVSREGLFGLVDISEGCWASLVLWLSRHSRLPPGTKIRIPRLLAGPPLVLGKTPFCSFCCRRPKPSRGQVTVLPGLHSHALVCIDLVGVH